MHAMPHISELADLLPSVGHKYTFVPEIACDVSYCAAEQREK